MPNESLRTELAKATGQRALLVDKAASLDYADLKDELTIYFSSQVEESVQNKKNEKKKNVREVKRYTGQEEMNDALWLEEHKSMIANDLAAAVAYIAKTKNKLATLEFSEIDQTLKSMGSHIAQLDEHKKKLVINLCIEAYKHGDRLKNITFPTKQQDFYLNELYSKEAGFSLIESPAKDAPDEEINAYKIYLDSPQGKLATALDELEKKLQKAIEDLELQDSQEAKVLELKNYVKNLKAQLAAKLSIQSGTTNSNQVVATGRQLTNQADAILRLLDTNKIDSLIEEAAKIARKRSDAKTIHDAILKIKPESLLESKIDAKQSLPPSQNELLTARIISACLAEINAFNNDPATSENKKIQVHEQKYIVEGILHAIAEQKDITEEEMDSRVAEIAGQFAAKTVIALRDGTSENEKLRARSYYINKATTEAVLEILAPKHTEKSLKEAAEEAITTPTKYTKIAQFWDRGALFNYKLDLHKNLTADLKIKNLDPVVLKNLASTLTHYAAHIFFRSDNSKNRHIMPILIETMIKDYKVELTAYQIDILITAINKITESISKGENESYLSFEEKIIAATFEVTKIAKGLFLADKQEDPSEKNLHNLVDSIVLQANSNLLANNNDAKKNVSDESRNIFDSIAPILSETYAPYNYPELFNEDSYQAKILNTATTESFDKNDSEAAQQNALTTLHAAVPKSDFEEIQGNLVKAIVENQASSEDKLESAIVLRQFRLTQFDSALDSPTSRVVLGEQNISPAHLAAGTYIGTKGRVSGIDMDLDDKGNSSYKPSALSRCGCDVTKNEEAKNVIAMHLQHKKNINKPAIHLASAPSVSYINSFVLAVENNLAPPNFVAKKIILSEGLENKLKFLAGDGKKDLSKLTKEQEAAMSVLNRITKHNSNVDVFIKKRNEEYSNPDAERKSSDLSPDGTPSRRNSTN